MLLGTQTRLKRRTEKKRRKSSLFLYFVFLLDLLVTQYDSIFSSVIKYFIAKKTENTIN